MAGTSQPSLVVDDEVRLRPWCRDDAPEVVEAFTTVDIQHWHARVIDNAEDAVAWIDRCNDAWRNETSATWAIVHRRAPRIAGRVTIYTDLEGGHGEVGYWMLTRSRGRGLATRACIAATRWAHGLGLRRVRLEHSVENIASARVGRALNLPGISARNR